MLETTVLAELNATVLDTVPAKASKDFSGSLKVGDTFEAHQFVEVVSLINNKETKWQGVAGLLNGKPRVMGFDTLKSRYFENGVAKFLDNSNYDELIKAITNKKTYSVACKELKSVPAFEAGKMKQLPVWKKS